MGISLTKGSNINLTKSVPGLTTAVIGLGWKEKSEYQTGYEFDLDASALMIPKDGSPDDSNFIFYNNLTHPSGCLVHKGDNLTGGDGTAPDEEIFIDFSKVPNNIKEILIVVSIEQAESRNQNFGQVESSFANLTVGDKEVARFDLDLDSATSSGIQFCSFLKDGSGEWRMKADGTEFLGGLAGLLRKHGFKLI